MKKIQIINPDIKQSMLVILFLCSLLITFTSRYPGKTKEKNVIIPIISKTPNKLTWINV